MRSFFGNLTNSLRTFPEAKRSSPTKQSTSTSQTGSSRRNLDPKLSTYATQAELLLSRTVDVEGIALDGYGYTVSITAGDPTPRKRWMERFARKNRGDAEKGEAKWPMGRIISKPNGGFIDESLKNGAIEIVTRKSLEFRESFEENRQDQTIRGWDRFVL